MQSQNRNSDLGACSQVAVFVFDFILCVQRTHSTAVNEINVSQKTLHIYWQFSAMSHAIHKIVSKRRCQSHFSSRRSPHHGISKDSDLCASANAVFTMPMRGYAFVTLNLLVLVLCNCSYRKVLTICKNMK